jgi:hypothetical protein
MENKAEIAKDALKAIQEIEDQVKVENLIKDNKIEWKDGDKTYRVRKPSFAERQEADGARRKKYLEMITDNTYLFKKQWVELYKNKGINIGEKEKQIQFYQSDIKTLLLRLATAELPNDVQLLKTEVLKLRAQQITVSMEVTDLLSHCIEDQLMLYVNSYITYLVFEEKDGDNWVRIYKSFDEFQKSSDKCIDNAFSYMSYLIYSYEEKK